MLLFFSSITNITDTTIIILTTSIIEGLCSCIISPPPVPVLLIYSLHAHRSQQHLNQTKLCQHLPPFLRPMIHFHFHSACWGEYVLDLNLHYINNQHILKQLVTKTRSVLPGLAGILPGLDSFFTFPIFNILISLCFPLPHHSLSLHHCFTRVS